MIKLRTRVAAAGIAALALVGLAACGGGDSDSGGSDSPIKIMAMYTNIPALQENEIPVTLKMAVKDLNASGGINGRKLELVTCNAKADPNLTVQCARKAVTEKVAAVVGGVAFFPTVFPILEKGKIPWLGGFGISKEELSSSVSFPVGGGEAGWNYGQAKVLQEQGAKNPVYVTCEPAACRSGGEAFSKGWEKFGGSKRAIISIPDSQVDLSSVAASVISKGYDAIATGAYPNQVAQLTKELRQQGWKGSIVPHAGVVSDESIKAMGKFTEGVYVVGNQLPASNATADAVPAMKEYFEKLDAAEPGTPHSELGTNTWSAFNVFVDVAKTVKKVDAASMIAALDKHDASNPLKTRLGPDFTVNTSGTPLLEDYTRLAALKVAVSQIKDGQLTQDDPGTFLTVAE